ncbi:MAG: QueT transporter family protein [Thermovirga sp.]|nr:QueT transporter family protein [Thermovirga sp.]
MFEDVKEAWSKITTPKGIAKAAIIGAAYAMLTIFFAPISYGPVQVRVSEALTLLPWLWVEAIPGLFIGCVIANFAGGFGIIDVVFGSLATLVAAMLTRKMPSKITAAIPPVVVNAVIVGAYLSFLTDFSWQAAMLYVGAGEVVACFCLGVPSLMLLEKKFPRK